jgi:hypothetical protein
MGSLILPRMRTLLMEEKLLAEMGTSRLDKIAFFRSLILKVRMKIGKTNNLLTTIKCKTHLLCML